MGRLRLSHFNRNPRKLKFLTYLNLLSYLALIQVPFEGVVGGEGRGAAWAGTGASRFRRLNRLPVLARAHAQNPAQVQDPFSAQSDVIVLDGFESAELESDFLMTLRQELARSLRQVQERWSWEEEAVGGHSLQPEQERRDFQAVLAWLQGEQQQQQAELPRLAGATVLEMTAGSLSGLPWSGRALRELVRAFLRLSQRLNAGAELGAAELLGGEEGAAGDRQDPLRVATSMADGRRGAQEAQRAQLELYERVARRSFFFSRCSCAGLAFYAIYLACFYGNAASSVSGAFQGLNCGSRMLFFAENCSNSANSSQIANFQCLGSVTTQWNASSWGMCPWKPGIPIASQQLLPQDAHSTFSCGDFFCAAPRPLVRGGVSQANLSLGYGSQAPTAQQGLQGDGNLRLGSAQKIINSTLLAFLITGVVASILAGGLFRLLACERSDRSWSRSPQIPVQRINDHRRRPGGEGASAGPDQREDQETGLGGEDAYSVCIRSLARWLIRHFASLLTGQFQREVTLGELCVFLRQIYPQRQVVQLPGEEWGLALRGNDSLLFFE